MYCGLHNAFRLSMDAWARRIRLPSTQRADCDTNTNARTDTNTHAYTYIYAYTDSNSRANARCSEGIKGNQRDRQ
jgi:hypothetical protein